MDIVSYEMGSAVSPPSVSVIVTNYNYARYLTDCLDSIAAQTHPDFECVVVDDASTDDSVVLIERFVAGEQARGRFRLVRHEQNSGQMSAFITGLASTSGTFVVFVDADDLLFPDFIEAHLRAHLNQSYAVSLTCSDQLQIGDDGEVMGSTYPALLRDRNQETGALLAGLPEHVRWRISPGEPILFEQKVRPPIYVPALSGAMGTWLWSTTSAIMFRRAALELILSDDCDRFRICADYYLCIYAHAVGGGLIIPTVHGCYRRHGENALSSVPMVGGEQSPGNHLTHPPIADFNRSFVEHVVANAELFYSILGKRHVLHLIARFATFKKYSYLLLRGPQLSNNLLRRNSLVTHKMLWTFIKTWKSVSYRIRFVRKLLSVKR